MTTKTAPQILAKLTWPQKRALHSGMHGDVATTRPTMGALRRLGLVGPESFNPRFAPLTVEGQKVLALMMSEWDLAEIHAEALEMNTPVCPRCPGTGRETGTWRDDCPACKPHKTQVVESARFQVNKLGFRYYAVRDTKIGRNVRTMMGDAGAEARAEQVAAELNEQDAQPNRLDGDDPNTYLANVVLDALAGCN